MVEKIVFAALILLPAAGISAGAPPAAGPSKAGPTATSPSPAGNGKGVVRLDEVRITGSPEHPGVLFFLPRARFHLLPLRTDGDAVDTIPAEIRKKGAPSR